MLPQLVDAEERAASRAVDALLAECGVPRPTEGRPVGIEGGGQGGPRLLGLVFFAAGCIALLVAVSAVLFRLFPSLLQ